MTKRRRDYYVGHPDCGKQSVDIVTSFYSFVTAYIFLHLCCMTYSASEDDQNLIPGAASNHDISCHNLSQLFYSDCTDSIAFSTYNRGKLA
jgi:hypothetical protein